ncbi:MAG TPA: hypothetical protein VHW65_01355 [Gemmatimonadales bacterium]|nr:hypothetical protein [Gemmatimonadales bacterium]
MTSTPYPLPPLTTVQARFGGGSSTPPPPLIIGGSESTLLLSNKFLLDGSDLNAMAQLAPGVFALGDSGYSVMGVGPDQNSTLLDGMDFQGGTLPPDGVCRVNMATTSSDPSRGQFSGGQMTLEACRGHDFVQAGLRGSLVDPHIGWSDPASSTLSTTVETLNGFVSGPIAKGMSHYRLSVSGSRQNTSMESLLNADSLRLAQFGVAPDSVRLLNSTLASLGIPTTSGATQMQRESGTTLLTLDLAPGGLSSWLVTLYGTASRTSGIGAGPYGDASVSGRMDAHNLRLMARRTGLVAGMADELTAVASAAGSGTAPQLNAPSGTVFLGTSASANAGGITAFEFGGGSNSRSSATDIVDLRNELSRKIGNGVHDLSFGQEVTATWNSSTQSSNLVGSFAYTSLADLQDSAPALYRRSLSAVSQQVESSRGALWFRDTWVATRMVTLQGGVRLDANRFDTDPAYNLVVDSLFGRRTDRLPTDVALSPRLGFAWLLHRSSIVITDPRTGTTRTLVQNDKAAVSPTPEPRGNVVQGLPGLVTLFASAGAYRGTVPTNRISDVFGRTGLPGAVRTLSCVGDAVPAPDWQDPDANVFDACANGGVASYSGNQSSVALLDPSFRAPVSWRANAGLNGFQWHKIQFDPSVTVARNDNVESRVDLNLQRNVAFTVPNEADRPVFAAPDAIVPETGQIAPGADRLSDRFEQVINTVSDLHSSALQLQVKISAGQILGAAAPRFPFSFEYSYNASRTEQRGFGATTAGDPFAVTTFSGTQPRHQFVFVPGSPLGSRFWWLSASVRLSVLSGQAITPIVAGDINGDGFSNDRAFIPDPRAVHDSLFAAGLRQLLDNGTTFAHCLQSQVGHIAGANSCRGPWQMKLDVNLDFRPPRQLVIAQHLTAGLRFVNAGATLLRLLGVSSSVTTLSAPDPRLLYVTGFDRASETFVYRVNQSFGQPLASAAGNHQYPPFEVQLVGDYKIGGAPRNPFLRSRGLDPEAHPPMTDDQIAAALTPSTNGSVGFLMRLEDSLGLSSSQRQQIGAIDSAYRVKADSLLAPVVRYVASRGRRLTDADFQERWRAFATAIDEAQRDSFGAAYRLLSATQVALYRVLLTRAQ